MKEVIQISVLNNYKLMIFFKDGKEIIIDFEKYLENDFNKKLLDLEKFSNVKIDSGGGIYWENGYDFCPNYLYDL